MLRFQSFQSGSNGNAAYLGSDRTHLLLDAGISCKRITEALHSISLDPRDLNGILITHEHSDHISGLFTMVKKYGIPLYGTRGTLEGIMAADKDCVIDESLCRPVVSGESFSIGDLTVNTVHNSHDARDPVAYRVRDGRL